MMIFLATLISGMFLFLSVIQLRNKEKMDEQDKAKATALPFIMMSVVFDILCSIAIEDGSGFYLSVALSLGVVPLCMLSISFVSYDKCRYVVWGMTGVSVLTGLYYLASGIGWFPVLSKCFFSLVCLIMSILAVVTYVYWLYRRLSDLNSVMRTVNTWTNVSLAVDSVYMVMTPLIIVLFVCVTTMIGYNSIIVNVLFAVLLSGLTSAYGARSVNSSLFVIKRELERMIIESMKISRVDSTMEEKSESMLYKNIYDRIQEYFAEKKPYLDPKLTINDIAVAVFTNRLYISKAISKYTGRNFCQFVNYYRVAHAVELFRNNMDLKVSDLANNSGFNSVVSFGTAFRLYMGEKPSDWCRKERTKLKKLRN